MSAFLGTLAAILLGVIVVALVASGAHAQTRPTSSAGNGQYGVSLASVTSLTVPVFAGSAQICVEGAAARYTTTGTTPSSTVGIPVAAGTCFQFAGPFSTFQIIGAGATLDVEYFK
jgi:hypothetical protein